MQVIVGARRSGKTSELIGISSATLCPIVAADMNRALCIYKQAKSMGKEIPNPLTIPSSIYRRGRLDLYGKSVLVDDVDAVLSSLIGADIFAATVTGFAVELVPPTCISDAEWAKANPSLGVARKLAGGDM